MLSVGNFPPPSSDERIQMASKRASKGELLLNEIDAIIERTNNRTSAPTTNNYIPNETITSAVVLEDMTKKPRFNVPPPTVLVPDSHNEKSNSIKERAKTFQQGSSSTPTSPPTSTSGTTNAQHLDTTVPTHRKSSFVADAIAAVQNKNMSVNLPEQPVSQASRPKAWPNVGSGMLRSSKSSEIAALPVSHTTLATDDIPTADEPQITSDPVPLPVTASVTTAGTSTQVPTTARNKLAAFLAASSQKDVILQQVLSQGSASVKSNSNDILKVSEEPTKIPETEKKGPESDDAVTNKPHRKPSIVMNAMAQLQSKGG